MDPLVLLTLPERVYCEGWAEIVKYAMSLDAALFEQLESHTPAVHAREGPWLSAIIACCIQLKMDIVGQDERDGGLRTF